LSVTRAICISLHNFRSVFFGYCWPIITYQVYISYKMTF